MTDRNMHVIPTNIKSDKLVEKRREQITLAAIELFSKKGFHKTTVRDLSREAGISQGNIYDYIKTKEDIFFLIYDFIEDLVNSMLTKVVQNTDDPFQKLRQMIRSEFTLMYKWSDAILILYQDTHILDKEVLKKLLGKEREHISKYEDVLRECFEKEKLRSVNLRLTANLIKAMIDSWVLKRWDLKGHVDQMEMERSILDLLSNGLLKERFTVPTASKNFEKLKGKSALIISGGSLLGREISSLFVSNGVRVVIQERNVRNGNQIKIAPLSNTSQTKYYELSNPNQAIDDLFKKIIDDFGLFDIIIQDFNKGQSSGAAFQETETLESSQFEKDFRFAKYLATFLKKQTMKSGGTRIVYIAPWAWDKFDDPIQHETEKSAIVALTKTMSREMRASNININCVIPGFIGPIPPTKSNRDIICKALNDNSMGCGQEISDIVSVVFFLVSDSSKCLTGQILEVGGGMQV